MPNRIETFAADGSPNGFVVPIWHVDSGDRVDQVYLTVVNPYSCKGPHLHMKRRGLFTCISGHVLIVSRPRVGYYLEEWAGEGHGFNSVKISPGVPAALFNRSDRPAYVLNTPSPPWRESEPDEWPVENWDYDSHFDRTR